MRISKKKVISFIILFLFLVGLIWGAVYLKKVADYKQAVKETAFDEIDVANVSDGIYIGEYDVDFIYNKEEQKTDVDAISGATNSSSVIKKSVENALKGSNINSM